jgi:Fe-Mn family superoxide dismutase
MAKNKSSGVEDQVIREIRKSLGLPPRSPTLPRGKKIIKEAYVTQAKKFSLTTEFLSQKTKHARQLDFERHVSALNNVAAQLEAASREDADKYSSEFRNLKVDEVHCLNASFLRALHFENISDPQSQLAMDSITFMRLERDFGTFDEWQKDFIACGMAARSGYVVTGYNTFLNRYMNYVIDEESKNVPVGMHPVIVLDTSEGAYYRDYLDDRKTYIIAMMKELDWDHIDKRFKRSERLSKISAEVKN